MNNLNYGVVGNCRTAALISEGGSIDWLCFPSFDSPSVFSKLIDDEHGGSFTLLVSADYRCKQTYVKETNILRTLFESEEGSFEVFDFMPRYRTINFGHHSPPELCRYIRPIAGTPRFRVQYNPVMNYGKEKVNHLIFKDYIRSFSQEDGNNNMYLYSSLDFNQILESREVELVRLSAVFIDFLQTTLPGS